MSEIYRREWLGGVRGKKNAHGATTPLLCPLRNATALIPWKVYFHSKHHNLIFLTLLTHCLHYIQNERFIQEIIFIKLDFRRHYKNIDVRHYYESITKGTCYRYWSHEYLQCRRSANRLFIKLIK